MPRLFRRVQWIQVRQALAEPGLLLPLSHGYYMDAEEKLMPACGQASAKRQGWGGAFREKRMKLFFRLAERVPRPATLLDIGGTTAFWRGRVPEGFSITLLNLFAQETSENVVTLAGDGCDLSRFEKRSFDVVFSNSVLGHVGGWERQRQMAGEIQRVGCRYFVQTPNQHFPIDWRTLVPFFHWLPPSAQAWCFQRFPVGRYRRAPNAEVARELATRVRNVTRAELGELFPGGMIVAERVCGFAKSFMVHHGFGGRGNE